jgi:hypothetical protein
MECPGLYSLFSAFELSFESSQRQISHLKYAVSKFDNRFGLVKIQLEGGGIYGTIKSFLRPTPVVQSNLAVLQDLVNSEEFVNQRALVIGGSRGIGASVRITYYQGEQDATNIVNEIVGNGGKAVAVPFNVLSIQSDSSSISNDNWVPTHCYYFATPFIFSGIKGIYSEKLFNKFCSYYLTGFYNTVNFWQAKGTNNFFYPSTIAVDELPDNMLEYALSKSAGEKLCKFMVNNSTELYIYKPRFPRMATDQTVSFIHVNNQDPVQLTLKYLRAFHSSSKS